VNREALDLYRAKLEAARFWRAMAEEQWEHAYRYMDYARQSEQFAADAETEATQIREQITRGQP
jgi:hypothetical protein